MNEIIIEMSQAEPLLLLPELYRWGIEVIRVIQRVETPFLTALIKFITALGTEKFYVPLILIIFWWIDENRGFRFAMLIIVSAWINAFMKGLLRQPRPFNLEPSLGLAFEPSYGAPSGHAQMSLCFWIPMAAWLSAAWRARVLRGKKGQGGKIIWAFAVFFILLMGFTRLYLGVHFPTDIFAGWILGGVILALWYIPGPFLEKRLAAAGVRAQNICAAAIALLMNGLFPQERTLPALFLGFCIGYNLMKQRFPFSARGKKPGIPVFVLRCVTGFAGMVILYIALKFILPGEGSLFGGLPIWGQASPFYDLGRFVRYGLLGFWASAGAPYMFQRMGLASASGRAGEGD